MLKLVLGGSSSGKSEYGEEMILALAGGDMVDYIATMNSSDEESGIRIKRHRKRREGSSFVTVEKPCHVGELCQRKHNRFGLLECVSNLLANEMFSGYTDEYSDDVNGVKDNDPEKKGDLAEPEETAARIVSDIISLSKDYKVLVVISNNIFEDSIIYEESVEEYIRCLGLINQKLAAQAEEVIEVICGIPVCIK
ncbi:adenosylcobinamide kinase /adenosylcobinamide-phosphate guanylyltransferase [Eubacterium ruminantium]|nr:adenosylcobinamide kinase /adenosylcobinamide-phosphate guanylyltransferase [Eubacterium ruminantium]